MGHEWGTAGRAIRSTGLLFSAVCARDSSNPTRGGGGVPVRPGGADPRRRAGTARTRRRDDCERVTTSGCISAWTERRRLIAADPLERVGCPNTSHGLHTSTWTPGRKEKSQDSTKCTSLHWKPVSHPTGWVRDGDAGPRFRTCRRGVVTTWPGRGGLSPCSAPSSRATGASTRTTSHRRDNGSREPRRSAARAASGSPASVSSPCRGDCNPIAVASHSHLM